jgi:outer membrane protein TolC/menaquinone-dependent protoporphyrinogen IX oxidase
MAGGQLPRNLANRSLPRRPEWKMSSRRKQAIVTTCFLLITGSNQTVLADVGEADPQSVGDDNIRLNGFIEALDSEPTSTAKPKTLVGGVRTDTFFGGQLIDLNAGVATDKTARPFELAATMNRFEDGSFSDLAKMMPTLIPAAKADQQNSNVSLEFRAIKKLTIELAMQLTLKQNLQIGIANESLNAAKWNYAGALGGFAPSIQLDLQQNGTRKYTTVLPRKAVDTDNTQLFSNFNHNLFQGGKVLFTAINTHELFLQQKGLFAAARNDNLNTAVLDYYNILSNQATLNIRFDSALFCLKQLKAFRQLYLEQTQSSSNVLNQANISLSALREHLVRMAVLERNIAEILMELENSKGLATGGPQLRNLRGRLERLRHEVTRVREGNRSLNFSAALLSNLVGAIKGNEDYKRSAAEESLAKDKINQGLPGEAEQKELSITAKDGIVALRTKFESLQRLFEVWRQEVAALQSANSGTNPFNEAFSALEREIGQTHSQRVSNCLTQVSAAKDYIDLLEPNLLLALTGESNGISTDLAAVVATVEQRVSLEEFNKRVAPILNRQIKTITAARLGRLVKAARKLAAVHFEASVNIARATALSGTGVKTRQALLELINAEAGASARWQSVAENVNHFVSAYQTSLQTSKQAADFLTQLTTQLNQTTTLSQSQMQEIERISNEIDAVCDDIETLSGPVPGNSRQQLRQSLENLRLNTASVRGEGDLGRLAFSQAGVSLTRAQEAENIEAGYAYQVAQWITQLASDTQDIINAYITLRTSSIAMSVLLNLDPRSNLLSNEAKLGCKVRDLSTVGFVELVRETLNNRPELFAADEFRRAALANIGVAASSLLPTISAFGQVTTAGASNRFDTVHLLRNKTFGWEVSYKFTNLLLPNMANVAAQGANAIQAYLKFRDQLNQVMQQVHNSYINVQTAKLKVAIAMKKAQKATQQLVDADTPEKRKGASASNIDVITALQNRNTAMADVSTNMANYNAAQAQLLHDTGQIYPISNFLMP